MKSAGFTLIELVIVIAILGILSAVAVPKYLDLKDEAEQATMLAMKGALKASHDMVALKMLTTPDNFNGRGNIFTLENGDTIRVRGNLPDGRWNNTFANLVDFEDIAQVSTNNCTNTTLKWCVRQRGQGWFNSRGYSSLGSGRGFVIFPQGNNVNQDRCYIYYMNQNATASPAAIEPSIIDVDFSEC